jgi:hypothetical protein
MSPMTTSYLRAAPNLTSARVKQLASLAKKIFVLRAFKRSSLIGFPLRQSIFAFFKMPVEESITPGVLTPIISGRLNPERFSNCSKSNFIWSIIY